jgi:hypothetical protein
MLGGVALALGGCGGGATVAPQALRLERTDMIDVARALDSQQRSVRREVSATKAAWPLIANGLPRDVGADERAAIAAATRAATALRLPGLFDEQDAAALTGPGSGIAGVFRSFNLLAARGWRLIGAAIEQDEHGTPAAVRFARANVALYIESVYDAHFGLAQIGKQLHAGYEKLGGTGAFGSALTQAEIDALADGYSEANDRLHPHTGVRLGS